MSEGRGNEFDWLAILDEGKKKDAQRLLNIISEIEAISSQARNDGTLFEDIREDATLSGIVLSIKSPGIWKPFSPAELLHKLYIDTNARLDSIRANDQFAPGALSRIRSRVASLSGGFYIAVSGKELNPGEVLDKNLESNFLVKIDNIKNRLVLTNITARSIHAEIVKLKESEDGLGRARLLANNLVNSENEFREIQNEYLKALDELKKQIFSSPESVFKLYKAVLEIRKMLVAIKNIYIEIRNSLLLPDSSESEGVDASEIDTEPGLGFQSSPDSFGLAGIHDTDSGAAPNL